MAPKCDKHGCYMESWSRVGSDARGFNWQCPQCGEEAIQRQAVDDHASRAAQDKQSEQARRQAELERRMGAAAIPERFREFDFDTFPGRTGRAAHACQRMRTYANRWHEARKRGVSVLLMGSTGTGKTGLACSVANRIMREDHATALFISAYGAVRHQRDTWGRRGKTEREALDDLISPDLLILDEVGASVGNDAEMTALFEVLNGRYGARKPTFLLSNLPMQDYEAGGRSQPGLANFLGQRIVDRFRDDGSFILSFDWPSLRGGKQ